MVVFPRTVLADDETSAPPSSANDITLRAINLVGSRAGIEGICRLLVGSAARWPPGAWNENCGLASRRWTRLAIC